jgi:hypothetical protein
MGVREPSGTPERRRRKMCGTCGCQGKKKPAKKGKKK